MLAASWVDNKAIHCLSTVINTVDHDQATRRKQGTSGIKIFRPAIVKMYNKGMPGVDLVCNPYLYCIAGPHGI
jgi:hypothetical protein